MDLHVPGEKETKVDFTQPVDAIFYIRNAELGYRNGNETSVSVPFHPLVSVLILLFPTFLSLNYRLLLISLLSAIGALVTLSFCFREIAPSQQITKSLLLILLLPGGLAIATGNAEFPCLFLTSLLFLGLLKNWHISLLILLSSLAILTKPNALYMVPMLLVYFLEGIHKKEFGYARRHLIAAVTILIAWFLLMLFVGITLGRIDIYWRSRDIYTPPLTIGPLTFFQQLSRVLVHNYNPGIQLKYLTALAIPAVDMWLLTLVNLKEKHKLAFLAGLFSIFFITFATNNPNKVIVYSATFPGHFLIGILFLRQVFSKKFKADNLAFKLIQYATGIVFILFCVSMVIFFVLGTPLEWYF